MKRQYQALIQEYLSYFPCVVLIGARQSGKSTLMRMVPGDYDFFDLESQADYTQIAHDPDLFLRLNNSPLAIDEAQLLPELFPALRVAIDRDRQAYGKYLLSGSSSPELISSISESLAGRVGIIEVAPFSLSETLDVSSPNLLKLFQPGIKAEEIPSLIPSANIKEASTTIDDYWEQGGYPEPWLRKRGKFQSVWREQYIKTYIERDIGRLFPALNKVRFRRFIELLAGYSGSIINYSNVANLLDVSQPTAKDYFRIAEGTFIWRNLPAYNKSLSKRVSKHPKGYLRDTGLMHHILQIPSTKRLISHPQMGHSWEALVIEEILRTLNSAGIQYASYYYRTSGGAEVDLILEGNFGLIPVEIKYGQQIPLKKLRPIRDFVNEFNCPFGIIVNNDEKIRLYEEKLIGIPLLSLIADEQQGS
ncbi:ATP-binding protein [Porticoccus sp. GXU_MW_L64]